MNRRSEEIKERMSSGGWFAGGWVAPTVVVLFTLLWVFLIYATIGDRSSFRTWQYGTAPYVPAESPATSAPAQPGVPPHQIDLPRLPQGGGRNAAP